MIKKCLEIMKLEHSGLEIRNMFSPLCLDYFVLPIGTFYFKVTGPAHSSIQYHLIHGTRSEIEGTLVEHIFLA